MACTLVTTMLFYDMTNLIGNQSKLEGFFKKKLLPAADDENNNVDTSRARRDGDVPAANTNCTIQRTSRIDVFRQ